uniref:Uncharacterized protein n=1 Tax=Wuchereria bancrofti TaxID=6293 RepID=A0A1I8EWC8_WUCBA
MQTFADLIVIIYFDNSTMNLFTVFSWFYFKLLVIATLVFHIAIITTILVIITPITTNTILSTAKQQPPHTLRCRQPYQQHRYDACAAHCSCIAARQTTSIPIAAYSALHLTITETLDMAFSG